MVEKVPYQCVACQQIVAAARCPRGWKNLGGYHCGDCFRTKYVVRAVTLPVTVPLDHQWDELRPVLKTAWEQSTKVANWTVQTLFRLDTVGEPKTPAAVSGWYGYGEAAKTYPDFAVWSGSKQSLSLILTTTHRKYIRNRFDALCRFQQHLLTYSYPFPYPVDADRWRLSEVDGFPVVAVALPGLGLTRLRLKRRADFGRQLAQFRLLLEGKALKGEAALYQDRKGAVLVKLVGWFPRAPVTGDRPHACTIHTDPNAFLVAEIDGRSPWILNRDDIRTRQQVHKVYLQRTSEDAKREKRMDRRQLQHVRKAVALRCDKHNNRNDTVIHQITAQVVRYLERAKVGTVIYDDARKEYIPEGFPWHQFKEKLLYKLDGMGIEVIAASEPVMNENPGTARTDTTTADKTTRSCQAQPHQPPSQCRRSRSRNTPKTGLEDGLKSGVPEGPR